jgi:Mg2+ and Co2+ transporter CorA
MAIRCRLFEAKGQTRDVELTPEVRDHLSSTQLLWVDVDERSTGDVNRIREALDLDPEMVPGLIDDAGRAAVRVHGDVVHLTLESIENENELRRREIDVLAGENIVVTIHDGPVEMLDLVAEAVAKAKGIGSLDSAGFLALLGDHLLTSYFRQIEEIEREIDKLDDLAIRPSADADVVLHALVRLRRRIGFLRRTLAPHREAFGPLARPDFKLHEELGLPWLELVSRLEAAIAAVELTRDLLFGSVDIFLGRAAQRSNDVMKILTIQSAILLPAVVLAGIMGMNFQMPWFGNEDTFWLVILVMVAFGVSLLVIARLRRWL